MPLKSVLLLVVGSAAPSMIIAWAAGFVVRRLAIKMDFVDRPGEDRKVHTRPTPLGGGLAIWMGVSLTLLAANLAVLAAAGGGPSKLIPEFGLPHLAGLQKRFPELWALWAGGTLLMIVGLIDDRRGLSWQWRLAAQFAVAATICTVWDELRLTAFIQSAAWLHILLSVVWIVALINSFNMLDNMDGLSGGIAAIAGAILAAALLVGAGSGESRPQLFVAGFLLVLVGGLLGFLWHNRPPARMFMGDAGSYFVGYCIAIATLLANWAGYQSETPHAIFTPLCVMAVPLYDMTTVLWIRVREGRSPFQADRSHFSHRLVELGLTKTGAVLTIYLTTATCGFGALLLPQLDLFGAGVVFFIVVCVLALIYILETMARRKLNQQADSDV